MKDSVIVNYASGKWYPKGQQRLADSLVRHGWSGDVRLFGDHNYDGPSHADNPYAFKPYLLDKLREEGYRYLLWLDASMWVEDRLDYIFYQIQRDGYFLVDDGHRVSDWTSDACLDMMQTTRQETESIRTVVAGAAGFDAYSRFGRHILCDWQEWADRGAFIGPWDNKDGKASSNPRVMGHRHDLSVLSILAHDEGCHLHSRPNPFYRLKAEPGHSVIVAEGL